MDIWLNDMTKSGVVGHLCMYHSRCKSGDVDWKETTAYAARTFDMDFDSIQKVIGKCKESVSTAAIINSKLGA